MTNIWNWVKTRIKNNRYKAGFAAILAVALLLGYCTNAEAAETDRAPLSVTQERLLNAGDVETFYVYNNSKFNSDVTSTHDFGALWAPFDFLTLGASSYYADGSENGVGDVFVFGTASVGNLFGFDVRPSVGVNVPNGFDVAVPAPEQISSGTYDLQPALTLVGDLGPFEAGAQYVGVFRLGDNDGGYTLGDENAVKSWLSIEALDGVVAFAAAEAMFVGSGEGVFAPSSYESVLVGGGLRTTVYGFQLTGEAYLPVHEDFSGVANFNEQRVFRLGVQRTF